MQKLYILTVLMLWGIVSLHAQINLTAINSAYEQNFNSLPSTGTTNDISTLPQGWTFIETGSNANMSYAASTGSSNAGNTYSFGTDADRAFGGLLSGSLNPTIGASFTNNTGTVITALNIIYKGEEWRLGSNVAGREPDRIDFQYSVNATSLNTGTWTDVNELDFNSPVVSGTVGLLNGNDAVNNRSISFVISGLNIASGQSFFIRWQDFNVANADDGLGVDDFSLTPQGTDSHLPSLNFTPASLAFGEVNVNQSDIKSYKIKGSNLTEPIAVAVSDPNFSISDDMVSFGSSLTVPDTGAIVYVRFTPTSGGAKSAAITHTSSTVSEDFQVSGSGFDQASNIITIATARTKSVGTKVTIAGRITVANELGNPAYVQDATGGIPVFYAALATSVTIGDSVIVTGPIGVFNSQVQISGNGIFFTKVSGPSRMITPKAIDITQMAANEGLLVTVQNVELVNKNLIFYPQSTERITNGSVQADLRIDGSTNIPGLAKPQSTVDITGVVGRFGANAQLLPRFQEDVPGAIEPTVSSDSIPKNKTLDVVDWNFEFFGAERENYNDEYGPEDEALQLQNAKTVLLSLQADVIAAQEISNDSLFAVLVSQLGRYKHICSDRYSHSFDGDEGFPPQKVCFIYDTTTVSVLSTRVLFEEMYDAARSTNPSLLPGYPGGDPSSFFSSGRLPFMLTANFTIEGVTEKISLINIHGKSGSAAADRNRRAYDAAVLKDTLDTAFASEKFIVLGDLNDDLDQSITAGQPSPYQAFVTDVAHYIPITKTLSDIGAKSTTGFNDVIDHQILSNELGDAYIEGSVKIIAPFRMIPDYANTTSDHLPVMSRYELEAPVVSFTQSSLALSEDSTSYTVHVTLTKPVTTNTQLTITLGGTATGGVDYTTNPAIQNDALLLSLVAGDSTTSFVFTVVNDQLDELAETATFTIQPTLGIAVGEASQLTITIEDNDVPTIMFAERYAEAKEGSGSYAVKLNLSTPPATDQSATIQLYALPWTIYGQDFTTDPTATQNKIVVNIPAGSSEAEFSLTPLSDRKRELPLEIISFVLAETSSGLHPVNPRISLFSIIDVKTRGQLAAYPNPTRGKIQLAGEGFEDNDVLQVELTNERGTVLLRRSGTLCRLNEELSNSMQHQQRGVYMIKALIDDEVFLIRVVKN